MSFVKTLINLSKYLEGFSKGKPKQIFNYLLRDEEWSRRMSKNNDKKISVLSYFITTSITQSKPNRFADIQINTTLKWNQIRKYSLGKYFLPSVAEQIQFPIAETTNMTKYS